MMRFNLLFALPLFLMGMLVSNGLVAQCPVAGFSLSADTLCLGDTLMLTNSSTGATSYTWEANGSSFSTSANADYGTTVSGTVTITLIASNGTCNDTLMDSVFVNSLPAVSFPDPMGVCVDSDPFALSGGTPAGGVYGGTAVSGGDFSPALAGVGLHDIHYTVTDASTGCSARDSAVIEVYAVPTAQLFGLPDACENAAPITLSGGTPAGGNYFGTGVSAGQFDPAVAGVGLHAVIYTYVDANGCQDAAIDSVEVFAMPAVNFPALTPLCDGDTAFMLSTATPAGGTYSGTGVSAGSFDPQVAGAGSFTITYSYTDSNSCSNTDSSVQEVNALPVVTLVGPANLCADDPVDTLTGGSPAGGLYSGTGVSNGVFDPTVSGSGSWTIDYTYIDSNGCSAAASAIANVFPPPFVALPDQGNFCVDVATTVLTGGFPAGGTYAGPTVTDSIFEPITAGAGSHVVSYSFTDGVGCSNTVLDTIQVFSLPNVNLLPFADLCAEAVGIPLFGGTPLGGSYSGAGVQNDSIFPALLGSGTWPITYTFTNANGCSDSATSDRVVNPLPTPSIGEDQVFCGDSVFTLMVDAEYEQYFWSTGSMDTTLDATITGPYAVTVTDSNLCLGSDTVNLVFYAGVELDLGPDSVFLEGTFVTLFAPTGLGDYLWDDGSTGEVREVDFTGWAWLQVTDSNGCTDIDSVYVTLYPTGQQELKANQQVVLFPNPVGEQLFLRLEQTPQSPIAISWYDLQGRLVHAETVQPGAQTMRLDAGLGKLPGGTYIVTGAGENVSFRQPIILIR